jgi:tagatose 1,6-diphosphate aldolase GatY/KbaY
MILANSLPFVEKVQQKEVAIAAFNIHNTETTQAVVEGAEAERAPVIIQTTPGTLKHTGISYIVGNIKMVAEENSIPIVLHMDHFS